MPHHIVCSNIKRGNNDNEPNKRAEEKHRQKKPNKNSFHHSWRLNSPTKKPKNKKNKHTQKASRVQTDAVTGAATVT